ncbi:MucR family transcriptional regulator [soil metagenome]
MTEMQSNDAGLLDMTVGIVANYVGANKVDAAAVPGLIQTIYSSLASLGEPVEAAPEARPDRLTPAQVRKLVTPGGIISLINQKPFKSMKRHISTHGYTPESYRDHFGLPANFPMVHPDYAKARSDLAKSMGLGQGGRKPANAAKPGRKSKTA